MPIENRGHRLDLTWKEFNRLICDPLCLEERNFRAWLKREARKRAWPCHMANPVRRRPGRPLEKRDAVEALINRLGSQGKITPQMSIKEICKLVAKAKPFPGRITPYGEEGEGSYALLIFSKMHFRLTVCFVPAAPLRQIQATRAVLRFLQKTKLVLEHQANLSSDPLFFGRLLQRPALNSERAEL